MKQLLFILFLIPASVSASEIFLLPDHTSDALHTLNITIGKAEKSVLIITPALQSRSVRDTLEKPASSALHTTLVISSQNAFETSALSQYRHIDLRTLDGLQSDYSKGKITGTLMLIDQKELCLSSTALDEKAMKQDIGFLECTRETQRVKTYLRHAKTLLKRSEKYLK